MDLRTKAAIIAGERGGLRLRQAVVVSAVGNVVTLKIAGSDAEISGVVCLAHVSPAPSDVVWLLTDGLDLLVIGKIA
jgi:hypothetical protein